MGTQQCDETPVQRDEFRPSAPARQTCAEYTIGNEPAAHRQHRQPFPAWPACIQTIVLSVSRVDAICAVGALCFP
jgi:hypothetical protein